MGNLILAEWYKLRLNRSFWLLSGLIILASILIPTLDRDTAFWLEAMAQDQIAAIAMDFNNRTFLKVAPAIFAGFFITSEYGLGTMRNIIASGNSRFRIFIAKLSVFSIASVFLSILHPIVTIGTVSLIIGENAFPSIGETMALLGLLVLYAAAFASIIAAFAVLFTNSAITIAFLIIFFIVNSRLIGFPYIEDIYQYTVFHYVFYVGQNPILNSNEQALIIIVPLLTIVGFILLGTGFFHRKEIK